MQEKDLVTDLIDTAITAACENATSFGTSDGVDCDIVCDGQPKPEEHQPYVKAKKQRKRNNRKMQDQTGSYLWESHQAVRAEDPVSTC